MMDYSTGKKEEFSEECNIGTNEGLLMKGCSAGRKNEFSEEECNIGTNEGLLIKGCSVAMKEGLPRKAY